jgi:putative transposase
MREWKSSTSRRIRALRPRLTTAATTLWQREFFDHFLRSDESYAQRWDYVRDNPGRAGLVRSAADWPYAGTIEDLEIYR